MRAACTPLPCLGTFRVARYLWGPVCWGPRTMLLLQQQATMCCIGCVAWLPAPSHRYAVCSFAAIPWLMDANPTRHTISDPSFATDAWCGCLRGASVLSDYNFVGSWCVRDVWSKRQMAGAWTAGTQPAHLQPVGTCQRALCWKLALPRQHRSSLVGALCIVPGNG